METRTFGRTELQLGILGFGCGSVGGLMARGSPKDQERAVARALEAGVNYFDTAVQYGEGQSEINLGRALKSLKAAGAVIGTKVRLKPEDHRRIGVAVAESLEASLKRLGREQVDIFHLHNPIAAEPSAENLSELQVLDDVAPALDRLRHQGKAQFIGLTAIGDTNALKEAIDSRLFDSAQVVYNMLNPSAATALPPRYPAQDYGRLFEHTKSAGVGVIAIRVLAGGALTGSPERHPIASPAPAPIGSGSSFESDLGRAKRLSALVEEGFADSLAEAATRFALSHAAVGTILVGVASPEQFETALAAAANGPLPQAALSRLAELRRAFVGEAR